MPISFDLEEFRKKHNIVNYFETGLYDVRFDVSCKKALNCGFKKLYSIELREDFVEIARLFLNSEISNGRLTLIRDDSSFLEKYTVNNPDFKEKTLFFLDAHVDNNVIKNYVTPCPVLRELEAISKLERKDHVICIDDVRILETLTPWGETLGSQMTPVLQCNEVGFRNYQNHITHIMRRILTINKDYKFTFLEGQVEHDVLCAFV